MLAEDSLIPAEAIARVGTATATATGAVVQRDWQRWAVAVKDDNPLYFDADYARAHGYADVICPPLYLQYAVLGVTPIESLRQDGTSGVASGSLAFPRCPKRMAGGEDTSFFRPCYDGDIITSVRIIESIVEKSGRSGRFVLVTWNTTYTNQRREAVAKSTTSMIARP